MASSIPSRVGVLLCAAIITGLAAAAEPLPISLDAESSTFDRQTNSIIFKRLNITQGDMLIRADEAVAEGLDFEQGEWRFTGSVMFTVNNASIEADSATVTFLANELQLAELVGVPARFEQVTDTDQAPISGGASTLSFDNVAQVMRMLGDAWFQQGPNEFRGCDLIYDLEQEQITSGSSDCGQPIVITILPRTADNGSGDTSSAQ
jgi:lipopolysaccharide transport protein LptA